jgi:outer membrane protein OmpA-like peptidoglycan-associated protein
VLFAPDAGLTPQATATLDQVRLQLSDTVDGAILLTGHSDPVESSAGRDDLSQARALAVANSLANAGIPTDHIDVRSVGSTTPATDAADCRDQDDLELAACLAPDRAVDVDVVALRAEAADQDNAANPDAMTPAAN